MKKPTSALLALLILTAGALAAGGEPQVGAEGDWFYLVKTEPSDRAREAEFNAWYDDIDIPDVLAVPSFKRARRAIGRDTDELPDVGLRQDDGRYAALYDIETADIDKAIIDLYVAARKMNALGRSTDALRVVEANYYRRLSTFGGSPVDDGDNAWFYVQKIICCKTDDELKEFTRWFDGEQRAALAASKDVVRVTLYELYRVMEELAVSEDEIPHLLALYEVSAPSPDPALTELREVTGGFSFTGGKNRFQVRDSILYLQLSDVRSD